MSERSDVSSPSVGRNRFRAWLRVALVPVVIVGLGIGVSKYFMTRKPEVRKQRPKPTERLVSIQRVERVTRPVGIPVMGTVIPARSIELRSRVGGEVVWVSEQFEEGALVGEGEELVRIDPVDYELAVARAEAALVEADYGVQLEAGRQNVARREWELLKPTGEVSEQERLLALRRPHRERVEAAKAAAEATLESARLDLERTRVRAPFNALVTARHTELGAQVAPQGALAELVGTDVCWIRASLPQDRLARLEIPQQSGEAGSRAGIRVRAGEMESPPREGRIVRLLGEVEAQGRMAEVLIEVEDPFGLQPESGAALPLLLGSYVRVELEGRPIADVVEISRSALRDGNRVWVADPDNRLDIRDATVAWRGPDVVLIRDGLETGDRLIVSDLPAPVPGMKLSVIGADGRTAEANQDPDHALE